MPEGGWPRTEAYQREMYAVIHAIPTILKGFACTENSGGRPGLQDRPLCPGIRALLDGEWVGYAHDERGAKDETRRKDDTQCGVAA